MASIEKNFGVNLPDYKELLENNLSLRRIVGTLTDLLNKREQELHDLLPALEEFQTFFVRQIDCVMENCARSSVTFSTNTHVGQSFNSIGTKLLDLKNREERLMKKIVENKNHSIRDSMDGAHSSIIDRSLFPLLSSQEEDLSIYYDTQLEPIDISLILKTNNLVDITEDDDESGLGTSNIHVQVPMNSTRLFDEHLMAQPTSSSIPPNFNAKSEGIKINESDLSRVEKSLEVLCVSVKEIKDEFRELKKTNSGISKTVEDAVAIGQKLLVQMKNAQPLEKEESSKNIGDKHSSKKKSTPKIVICNEDSSSKQAETRKKRDRSPSFKNSPKNSPSPSKIHDSDDESKSSVSSSKVVSLPINSQFNHLTDFIN
ncbi:hypothetical protein QAD02_004912 [Eretmocerus hayati]|uniref:Uncharacterized protein n=1 Tax=Eretmocerus hayati TaxID=131215 RepID=A0ACC2NVQ8_9HYME|nr:hypothetical protein QAD02_004912 [Eretmocerus hayati]